MKNKSRPAILNVNIGTTVKGAVDDLDRVSALAKANAMCWEMVVLRVVPMSGNVGSERI